MTSRHAEFASERVIRLGRFFQDILNFSKHAFALVNDLNARIKGILSEELSFLAKFNRFGKIFEDLTEKSDVFGDVVRLLRVCQLGLSKS